MIPCSGIAKEAAIEPNSFLHQAPDDTTTAGFTRDPMHINERSLCFQFSCDFFALVSFWSTIKTISEVCSFCRLP